MWGVNFKIHHLPVLVGVWFMSTFILMYVLSVFAGHVYPFFPFISDTVAFSPERCIFGLLMYFGSIMLATSMYMRYLQIQIYLNLGYANFHQTWNNASILVGITTCLGICITYNISEADSLIMHLVAAVVTIVFSVFYLLLQTKISFETIHLQGEPSLRGISKRLFYFRLFLICCITISSCTLFISWVLAYREFTGTAIYWWTEKDGGYKLHLISTFSEWLFFIFLSIYISTLKDEFKLIEFKKVLVELKKLKKNEGNAPKLD